MKSLLVFTFCFLCILVVADASKRSARWDAHLDHLLNQQRSKRQAQPAGCNWQRGKNTDCALQGKTNNDVLRRRTSNLLAPVESQGSCGSCWAFAATHTYTDARSLQAGSRTPLLSSQYLASCIPRETTPNGCCGGRAFKGLDFFVSDGTVTRTCAPYDAFLRDYTYNKRLGPSGNPSLSATCPMRCVDNAEFDPSDLRLNGYRQLSTDEPAVMEALRSRGPVTMRMQVSEDFRHLYRCGIFCHSPRSPDNPIVGNHAVEIVDYGTENGVDFWVIKNTWGVNWGEDGYFRMRRTDLDRREYLVPILSSEDRLPRPASPDDSDLSCSPVRVADPGSDELVMSAIDHTVDEVNRLSAIPCPDGSQASSVVFQSVQEATDQVVDGAVIVTDLTVDVLGCGDTVRATIHSVVTLNDDDTFDLSSHTFEYNNNGGNSNNNGGSTNGAGNVLAGSVAMVIAVVAAAILLL